MVQAVAKIQLFPEEQIQVVGIANINGGTAPMWGVARLGDKKPTGFRTNIVPANKFPNRIPRIPCQFVAVAFDSSGTKVNGGDVKDGLLYNGAQLPNGNTVELKWSATMKNGKWSGGGQPPSTWGDNRSPKAFIQETANAGAPPTQWLEFSIDDTGLLLPGNDGVLNVPALTSIGDTNVQFSNAFQTDRACDGFVKADYAEMKPNKTKTNKLPQVQLKAVIAQPDWAVEKDTPKGWVLP